MPRVVSVQPCMEEIPIKKKCEVKLELLANIDMVLMVEKGIRGGISNTIHRYAKANNKCMKDYDKNKESLS